MGETERAVFNRKKELVERLQQGPGAEAQEEMQVGVGGGPPPSRWTLRSIRATFPWMEDYTLSGVWCTLKRHGLSLRSARVQHYSPDPEYADKVDYLEFCMQETADHPDTMVLLFMDEMGFYRWPDPAVDWALDTETPMAFRGGENNRPWRIIGVLNAITGQVDYLDAYIVDRQKVIEMYEHIDRIYSGAECIFVVQDNWSIHRHPEVWDVLNQMPHIEPVWLPTYAPWLNPIEKLWRWLRQDVLKMHRLADDWDALRQRVRDFLDQFWTESVELLQYIGLLGQGELAQALW